MTGQVRWVDRETVAFVRGSSFVLVWCDVEGGLFSPGRVIREESIQEWLSTEGAPARPVTSEERSDIILAVARYWRRPWRRVRSVP